MTETITKLSEALDVSRVAYIRAIKSRELESLPNEALEAVYDLARLYVITNGEGQKLAIIEGREAAMATAMANALTPVSVH